MRTKIFLAHALCGVCLLTAQHAGAQATVPGNLGVPGAYSGWNGATVQPLEVRHNGNQPIQWFTDSLQRMLLTNTETNATVNGFDDLDLSGFLGVGHFNSIPGDRPLTYIHISDTGTFATGYRNWMRNGITMTGNADQGYVGQKFGGNDSIDMVIQWSDKQRLRRPRPVAASCTAMDRGSRHDTLC